MRLVVLSALGSCLAACATAPRHELPIRPEAECRTVRQLNAPSRGPSYGAQRPVKRVLTCPLEAGDAIASELERLRFSRDTAQLRRTTWLVGYLHDARVIRTAASIAVDTSASAEARVHGLRVLAWAKAPDSNIELSWFASEPKPVDPRRIRYSTSGTAHYYNGAYSEGRIRFPAFGEIVPRDFLDSVDAAIHTVQARGDAEPQQVRWAAEHARPIEPEQMLLALLESRWSGTEAAR